MTGDLPDRVRQAIPVAVVIHALRLLAPFDREALRDFSRALYYSDAQNPVDTGGRRPSPREEPATAVLPAVLTESKAGFGVEEKGSVVATHALPNNLIIAAVWMAWVDAQKLHGEAVPPLSDGVWVLLCAAVAAHRDGVSLRRSHAKWARELKRSWDPRGIINVASTTDHHKAGWLSWCQRAAAALGWRASTTVGAYEKAARPLVRIRPVLQLSNRSWRFIEAPLTTGRGREMIVPMVDVERVPSDVVNLCVENSSGRGELMAFRTRWIDSTKWFGAEPLGDAVGNPSCMGRVACGHAECMGRIACGPSIEELGSALEASLVGVELPSEGATLADLMEFRRTLRL